MYLPPSRYPNFYQHLSPPQYYYEKHDLRHRANVTGGALLCVLFGGTLFSLFFNLFLQVVQYPYGGSFEFYFMSPELYYLYNICAYILSFLVPALIMAAASKLPQNEVISFSKVKPDVAVGSIFVGVCVCLLSNIPVNIFATFLQKLGLSGEAPSMPFPSSGLSTALYIINLAILPPLFEEFLFRGFILGIFRRYGDGFAVVASAFLFAMMHANFIQIPFAFLCGLILGYIMVRTNCLWIPIVIHFFNNAFSVVSELLFAYSSEEVYALFSNLFFLSFCFFALLFLIILYVRHRWYFQSAPLKTVLPLSARLGSFFTSPSLLVFIGFCLLTSFFLL